MIALDSPLPPPAPHDPRERELALLEGLWEVRIFGGRKFEYFVSRGFWHLQLWHPTAGVSVLTPSRLTLGFYEMVIGDTKTRTSDYVRLGVFARRTHAGLALPSPARLAQLERALVDDVVRTREHRAVAS